MYIDRIDIKSEAVPQRTDSIMANSGISTTNDLQNTTPAFLATVVFLFLLSINYFYRLDDISSVNILFSLLL